MFPEVVSLSRVLAGQLLSASAPPSPGDQAQAVDVDNAAQRLTVDVIGGCAAVPYSVVLFVHEQFFDLVTVFGCGPGVCNLNGSETHPLR